MKPLAKCQISHSWTYTHGEKYTIFTFHRIHKMGIAGMECLHICISLDFHFAPHPFMPPKKKGGGII